MVRLAAETDEGFGNFNFAAIACTGPGTPFFPAAYHAGPANLTLALQGAGIVAEALEGGAELAEVTGRVKEKLAEHARPVVELAQRQAAEIGVDFAGIDLSPAPNGPDSIAAAMEQAGHGPVGSPGTLSLAAALTEGLKSDGPAHLWLLRPHVAGHGGRPCWPGAGRRGGWARPAAGLFGGVRHGPGHRAPAR